MTTATKICALLLAAALLSVADAGAAETSRPDFSAVLTEQSRALSSITADVQAQILFSSVLAPALDLREEPAPAMPAKKGAKQQERSSQDPPVDGAAIRFVGDLASWRLASHLKDSAETGRVALLGALKSVEGQRAWLLGPAPGTARPSLSRALLLADVLAAFEPAMEGKSPPGYAEYAARMDQSFPPGGSQESWLALAERDGVKGVRQRLKTEAEAVTWTDAERDLFVPRYFDTHLRPLFTAHLLASASRAEAEAERSSRAAWESLHDGKERLREYRGLARLCGSWQWTVHNHQNHLDHKMVVVFDPPALSQDRPAGEPSSTEQSARQPAEPQRMKPAKIIVLGDVVYLRWESAGGYQEDSLLFTGEGKRLEGSFTNSAGAWGSITGKRVAACPKNAKG